MRLGEETANLAFFANSLAIFSAGIRDSLEKTSARQTKPIFASWFNGGAQWHPTGATVWICAIRPPQTAENLVENNKDREVPK
jgi:hypothetical protein